MFQVKDWRGTATDVGALDQLVEAANSYRVEYPVRGAYLLTLCQGEGSEFRAYREARSRELQLPLTFIGGKRLLSLIRQYALSPAYPLDPLGAL